MIMLESALIMFDQLLQSSIVDIAWRHIPHLFIIVNSAEKIFT